MIVIRLMGGLGNQMFQYASAKALAHRLGTDLVLDTSWYDDINQVDTPRHYELDNFAMQAKFLPKADIPSLDDTPPTNSIFNRVKYGIKSRINKPKFNIYQEPKFSFNKELLSQPDNTYLVGYFQSEKYFKNIRSVILQDFIFTNKLNSNNKSILNKINTTNSVALHVRRGDYISNKNANKVHGPKGLDYYAEAVEIIAKKIKHPTFFIISDDPSWCKDNIKLKHPTVYITENNKGIDDMHLMTHCQHGIIANSSFSWWGAWLNKNPNKMVIAPKKWFNDPSIEAQDVVPNDWIRV